MQADLKSLLRTYLGQLAGTTATLAAIGDWMNGAAEERRNLLDEFQRRARANPAIKVQTDLAPPPSPCAKGPIAGA
jgi:hypothetical protein